MKKILLIAFLFNAILASAQFTVANDSVYEEHNPSEQDIVAHNTHSTTNPVLTMNWKVYSLNVPTGWENDMFVCDAIQCWDSTTNTNQYTLDDNKKYPLDVHLLNNGLVGTGNAKILVWEEGDSLNSVKIVSYTIHVAEGVSINKVEDISVSTYPNPVVNTLNIKNINSTLISKIEIYNIIGKKVYSLDNPKENETVDMRDFNKGIYILKITDKNQINYSQNILKN